MAVVLLSVGCHKASGTSDPSADATPPPAAPPAAVTNANQDSPAAVTASDTVRNPNPMPAAADPSAVSPSNPNVAPLAKANGEPDLTALDSALMGWVYANRRLPKNFADFAATSGQAIPRPPPGKKYIITQKMHVQLVNQ